MSIPSRHSARKRIVRFVFGALASTAALQAQRAAEPSSSEAEPQKLERFVVTGSYIPSAETAVEAGASPVIRIDRQSIVESGYNTVSELVQQISVANANSVPISNNATGFTPAASAISLRGLGPEATLVLINGRRVAPYPVGVGGSGAFVDLNSIPLAAVENIEVLKDGASALYGADAVAGVVNVRFRRGIDGGEAVVSYGNTTHRDAHEFVANIASGVTKGNGSLIVGLNYYKKAAIMNRDRAYSAVPPFLSTNSSPGNLELTRFSIASALGQPLLSPIPGVPNNAVFIFGQSGADAANDGLRTADRYTYSTDRTSTYNFNESSMSYPENDRRGAFVSGERKLLRRDNLKAYADLSYQEVRFENQLAPAASGDFSLPGQVPLAIPARTTDPILTVIDPARGQIFGVRAGLLIPSGYTAGPGSQIVNNIARRLAAPGAYNPFNPFDQDIANGTRLRLAEFGNRIQRNVTGAGMVALGVKGENVAEKWNFDASFSYSEIRDRSRQTHVSASRFNEIVDANAEIFRPGSARYVGTTTPYNPFGYYRTPVAGNAALVEYARVETESISESALGQLSFAASTDDLIRLSHGSVGLAFGGDFRREQLDQDADPLEVAGDLVGQSPRSTTSAQRKIGGAFVEARIPVWRNVELSGSVRHEKFFSSHRETTVPKFAVRYQPFDRQLTVRSSYSRGFREPSLFELYSSPIFALTPIQDPLTGQVEPEQRVTLRGNRRLRPEDTDYFNAGVVWTPTFRRLKGLTLSADFWAVTREGTVEANPQNMVYRAFSILPGGLYPGESLQFSSSGALSAVNTIFVNVGRTNAEGWDFSANYQLPTDALGRWEFTTVWTMMTRFDRATVEGSPLTDVLGRDSTGNGDNGYLEFKGRANVRWLYKGFVVALSGEYNDGFEDRDLANATYEVDDSVIVTLHVGYTFRHPRRRLLRDTRVFFGVQNLFDEDPPASFGGGRNSTGYPGHLYTAENQNWWLGVARKF